MTWKDIALQHAKKDAPHEACGLVAVYKGKEKYLACKNLAEELGEQFILILLFYSQSFSRHLNNFSLLCV